MDIATAIAVTGRFVQVVGETLADLRRLEISQIDIDLLTLKRDHLSRRLDDFKRDLTDAVNWEKGKAEQDLISRGLSNSTIRNSTLTSIEQDANTQLDRATREYSRALEEIAMHEKRIKVQARAWWKRLMRPAMGDASARHGS